MPLISKVISQLVRHFASFYNDDIMVFTPKGKGIILPKGATALDFAYEIHSKIGQHAVYARINGKLMSVKTVLHRGDCVEIGTNENSCPDTDWIDHVLTYKAKRHLRSYLSTVSDIEYQRCHHCHPLPGDEARRGQSTGKVAHSDDSRACKAFGLGSSG
mgnify:CR=1 FL=1